MRRMLAAFCSYLAYAVLLMLFVMTAKEGVGQTNTWNGTISNSWNTAANWSLNQVPTALHDVVIPNNFSVTVNSAAVCKSLTINGGGNSNNLNLTGTSLSVQGSITINGGTGNNDNKIITVGTGTLNAGTITINDTGGDNRDSYLSISTGSVTVSGGITMNGTATRNQIVFTGNGFLNIGSGGTIAGGAISNIAGGYTALSRGTVEYNGVNQTIGAYTYYNLTLSGSGEKSINTGTVVSGNFQMTGSSTATFTNNFAVSGTTTLAGTSQLILGAANILSATPLILGGGTLKTGATAGYSETVGTLSITDNSTISLGTGSHILTFANSSAVTWTSGKVLLITGWQGSWNGTTGTGGKIFAGNSSSGLTTTQLSQIQFINGTEYYSAAILSTGEIVPNKALTGFWYKADAGVTSPVATWVDQWGNGNNATNTGLVSLVNNSINFNPSLSFNNVNRQFSVSGFSRVQSFVIVNITPASNNDLAGLSGTDNDKGIRLSSNVNELTPVVTPYQSWKGNDNTDDWVSSTNGGNGRINGLNDADMVHSSKWHIANLSRYQALSGNYYLGGYYLGRGYTGNIAEVMAFSGSVTNQNQVESYLAVKYGITLGTISSPVGYVNSSGATIWAANSTYQNDVHGIGRDNVYGLNQLSSKSENPGTDVLTIQSGSLYNAPASAQTGTALTDGQFFITGHNGASPTTTSALGTGVTIISRKWYAQVTGLLPTESFQFDLTGASFGSYCKIGVLIADDASFISNLRFVEGTLASSILTLNNTAVSNGKYFTVATLANVTTGSISGSQTICNNTSPTTLTSAADGTGFGTISYLWESSLDGTSWNTVSGATSNIYSPGVLTQSTYYRRTTVATLGGVSCNSVSTPSVIVTVRPVFNSGAIAATGQTICSGETPTTQIGSITAASGGDNSITYQWQYSTDNTFATGVTTVASNTATYIPEQPLSQTTFYRRLAKDATCNSYTASSGVWQVTVNPLPQGSLSGSTICLGGTGQFTFTSSSGTGPFKLVISGTTYSGVVSGMAFNANPNPGSTAAYTLTSITDSNGCVRTSGIAGSGATITVNPIPQGSLAGNTICVGGTGQFTYTSSSGTGPFTLVVSGTTYSGVVSGIAFNANPNPGSTAAYTLTSITDSNGCVRTSGITGSVATITVNTLSTAATLITGASTICNGGTTTLSVSGGSLGTGAIWKWYSGSCGGVLEATGSSVTMSPTATTTYFVRAEGTCNATGCASQVITVRSAFTTGTIAGTGQSICYGNTPTVQIGSTTAASGGDNVITYQWQYSTDITFATGVTTLANNAPTYTPNQVLTQTTYYRRQAKDGTCNTSYTASSGVWQVTVNALPAISTSNNSPLCAGTALNLNSSGGTSYSWTGPNSFSSASQNPIITNVTAAASGTYTVTVTNSSGCVATATTNAVVNALPVAAAGSNAPQCAGGTLNLNSSGGSSYSWTGPNSFSSASQNPTITNMITSASGTYTVTVTNISGCTATATTNVTVNALPDNTATGFSGNTICAGGTGVLTFDAVDASFVSPYTIRYTDGTTTWDQTIASASSTSFNVAVNPTTTTTYALVSITNGNGCVQTTGFGDATAEITVRVLPQGSLSANGPFCGSGAAQLTWTSTSGTGPFTIVYSDGVANRTQTNVTSGTPFSAFTSPVSTTTTYSLVSVTDVNGCVRSTGFTIGLATITVDATIGNNTVGGAQTFCGSGDPAQLAGSVPTGGNGIFVYQWQSSVDNVSWNDLSGAISQNYDPTTITATSYYRRGVKSGICPMVYSPSIQVTINPVPTPTFSTYPTGNVCANDNVVFDTQSGYTSYTWTITGILGTDYTVTAGGTGSTSNTVTLKWITSGIKSVSVTYSNSFGCQGAAVQVSFTVNPIPQIGSFN